jgi:hypothetical protein
VLEIGSEPGDELEGEVGVVVLVEPADDLFGVPRHPHLATRVAGLEKSHQLGAATVVEPLISLREQASRSIERVVLVASVAERLVLDPPADLVEFLVRELHQMERISDLDRVGCHRVEHPPIRA